MRRQNHLTSLRMGAACARGVDYWSTWRPLQGLLIGHRGPTRGSVCMPRDSCAVSPRSCSDWIALRVASVMVVHCRLLSCATSGSMPAVDKRIKPPFRLRTSIQIVVPAACGQHSDTLGLSCQVNHCGGGRVFFSSLETNYFQKIFRPWVGIAVERLQRRKAG